MPTYSRLPIAFERGEGVWLWDKAGKRYLDALSGIAVCSLGHAHPAIAETVQKQSRLLMHTSNLYEIPVQEKLAQCLTGITGLQSVFFCNSGAEANEAAVKLVRLRAQEQSAEQPMIIVAQGAFHGRTLGMLAASGLPGYKRFAPLPAGFVRVPFGNIAAIEAAADATPGVCAVMIEPIQGEGGVRLPPQNYLKSVRDLCDARGLWLILDEVQTGIGRTGNWFGYQNEDIIPDVLTSAKALGNGVPIGACLAGEALSAAFSPGDHGSTFGGNLLACSVALTVIDVIKRDRLLDNAKQMGQRLLEGLRNKLSGVPGVREVRGKGLMVGVELEHECKVLVQRAMEHNLLINVTSDTVIRLLPPLIIQEHETDEIVNGVSQIVCDFLKEKDAR